jgi:hypothetical protein
MAANMSPILDADEKEVVKSRGSQDGAPAKHTPEQEARVVSKLDWNLMSLFFVLCKSNARSGSRLHRPTSPSAGRGCCLRFHLVYHTTLHPMWLT